MSDPCIFLGLNVATVVSTAVGVIAGGAITWVAAWYYAKESAKDTQRLIDEAVDELGTSIPKDAAKQVVADGVLNNLLTAGPMVFKVISRLAEAGKKSPSTQPKSPPPPAS